MMMIINVLAALALFACLVMIPVCVWDDMRRARARDARIRQRQELAEAVQSLTEDDRAWFRDHGVHVIGEHSLLPHPQRRSRRLRLPDPVYHHSDGVGSM